MKALVLCAGRGSRLRPLTHTRAKAALPVAGIPVLTHILSYLERHGFTEVGVVISQGQEELLAMPTGSAMVTFLTQPEPLGIANAVSVAEGYLAGEPFLLYLGDNLTDVDLKPALERFHKEQPAAMLTVREVSDPSAYGVAELVGDSVARVVEKPTELVSNLAIAGLYLFQSDVLGVIRSLQPSARGEYEITDAIAALISQGATVLAHRISGWWQDMGTLTGLLTANAHMLDQIQSDISPKAHLQDVAIQGRVQIGADAVLERVRLRGPLVIGPGCRLTDAYVGPYTSLGTDVMVEQATVENSVLLNGCVLRGVPVHLEDSLLGEGTTVESRQGRAVSLSLGDDSRLLIPPDRR